MTVAKALEAPPSAPTPQGYRTSEFWLTALGFLVSSLGAAAGLLPAKYAAIAIAIQGGIYNISRAWTKTGVAQAEAAVMVAKQ